MTDISSKEWHLKCYGETMETMMAMKPMMSGSLGWGMLTMSILSDSQEAMERGQPEVSRQFINKAKWIIANKNVTFGSVELLPLMDEEKNVILGTQINIDGKLILLPN